MDGWRGREGINIMRDGGEKVFTKTTERVRIK